jgi:hypothetical protein
MNPERNKIFTLDYAGMRRPGAPGLLHDENVVTAIVTLPFVVVMMPSVAGMLAVLGYLLAG